MTDNINTAILAIMNEVSYVQKERKSGVDYTLKTENAVIQAIRPAMLEHGVFVYPVGVREIHESQFEAGKYKNIWNRLVCIHVFRFQHVASDTHIDVEVLGDGADTGDKAGNKSMTTAKKYALLQTFLLETGDDPDLTQSPNETSKATNKPAKTAEPKQEKQKVDETVTDELWSRWLKVEAEAKTHAINTPSLDRSKVTASRLTTIGTQIKDQIKAKAGK